MEILMPKPWPYISQKCKLQKAEWEPEQNIKVIKVIEDASQESFLVAFFVQFSLNGRHDTPKTAKSS